MKRRARSFYNLMTLTFVGLTVLAGVLTLAFAADALQPPEFMAKADVIPPTAFQPVVAEVSNGAEPAPAEAAIITEAEPLSQAAPLVEVEVVDSQAEPVAAPEVEAAPILLEDNNSVVMDSTPVQAAADQPDAAVYTASAGADAQVSSSSNESVTFESAPVVVAVPDQIVAPVVEAPAAVDESVQEQPAAQVKNETVSFESGASASVSAPTTPLPGGPALTSAQSGVQKSPLRVMVPTDNTVQQLKAAGIETLADWFPNMDPVTSFSPGPRLELPFQNTPPGDSTQDAPASPFKTLAILVEFSDNPSMESASFFDTLLFGTGGGDKSVHNFYWEASYGQLDIVTVNMPSALGWQTAPNSYAYYVGTNNCTGSYPRNCQRLTEDLAAQVNSLVDFSDYDNNGDGYVDTVFIIHAGSGAEANGGDPSMIWSHSWWTMTEPVYDGVKIGSYTTEPEFWIDDPPLGSIDVEMTHGVYAHELGHALGLPDLYDIDYTSEGVGDWSLMSGGSWNGSWGDTPAHPDAWSRAYLEFNPVTNITGLTGTINVPNIVQNQNDSLLRIDSLQSNEYWLLENRQLFGSDAELPGSGLLIWHVDDNLGGVSNRFECKQVNNFLCFGATKHYIVAVEQADGDRDMELNVNRGDTGDPFPGSSNNHEFGFTTNPNTTSYYSSNPAAGGIGLYDISSSASTMSFSLAHAVSAPVLDTPTTGSVTPNNLPTFSWNAVTYASAYQIQVDNSSYFTSPEVNATIANSFYTLPSLLPDGKYYWRVRAFNEIDDPGPLSVSWLVTIDSALPAVPSLLTPKDHTYLSDTTPKFTWGSVSGAVGYQIQVSDDFNFGSTLIDQMPVGPAYTAITPLNYGVYYWRVKSHDAADNWSAWSPINTVTITILTNPKNAQHLTDITPTFTVASVGLGALYQIQVDEIGGNFTTPVFDSGIITSTVATPLTPLAGGEYQWRAQANAGAGWSVWTPLWTFTITPPTTLAPALITPLNAAVLDTTTPGFVWATVTGGVNYQIQIARTDTFANPVQDVTGTGITTYLADPLPDGGKYYWRVRAINSVGVAGAWSAKWTFILNQLARPVLVNPLTGAKTADTTPTFNWTAVTGAANYQIQIDNDLNFSSPVQTATVGGTTHTAAFLNDGKYYWRVQALKPSGVGGLWSAIWNVTVDTIGPAAPVLATPVNLAGTTDTTPTFTWKTSATAVLYHIEVATDSGFLGIVAEGDSASTSYTLPLVDALDYGTYYWHVYAQDVLGNVGSYSPPFSFAITFMLSPKDGSTTTILKPTFSWAAVAGAVSYHFQLSEEDDFNPLWGEYFGTGRSVVPNTPLDPGVYYWHVQVNTGSGYGPYMPTWTVIVTPSKPGQPVLIAPANAALTNDNTPVFSWQAAINGETYQIQIDNNTDFSSPEQDVTVGVGLLTYTATTLDDGLYYWRVRALNDDTAPGAWSTKRTLTVDTVVPAAPDLLTPIDGAVSTNKMLKLDWSDSETGARYELWLDQNPGFPLPPINVGALSTYTPPTPLNTGLYYWQVVAYDKAGNPSAFSATRSFVIVAGVTSPLLPTETPTEGEPATPVPTETPSEPTGTPEPTETPEPPTATPDVTLPTVSLPIVNTCDTQAGWEAVGAWRLAEQAGYRGGAWFADSTVRGYNHTLTPLVLIDLRTAQQPELRFWQRMGLSSGDVVAAEISVDGGLTWQPVYQQLGKLADWREQVVDLSLYRGMVVQLRFRLGTGGKVPGGEQTHGWWIDEVAVQEAAVVPPTAEPTEPPVPTVEPTQPPVPTVEPTEPPVPTVEPTEPPAPTEEPTATPEPPVVPNGPSDFNK